MCYLWICHWQTPIIFIEPTKMYIKNFTRYFELLLCNRLIVVLNVFKLYKLWSLEDSGLQYWALTVFALIFCKAFTVTVNADERKTHLFMWNYLNIFFLFIVNTLAQTCLPPIEVIIALNCACARSKVLDPIFIRTPL